jgi:peptidoglycan/LPS O-acetylase OafA/YrhL
MRFTFKDAVGAVLAAAAVLVALDVTYAWGWPLLGDYRAGVVALAVIGFAMCAAASDYSAVRWPDPLLVIAGALGVAALMFMIAGLIWATQALFLWLAAVIVALWLVATVRHALTPRHVAPARRVTS